MISQRERSGLSEQAARLLGLFEREQHAALLNEVDELSKAGPLEAGVLGVASLTLTELERYEEGRKAAEAAIDRAPAQAWLYGALAAAEAGAGRREAAVEAQRRAVQLMPGEPGYGALLARYQRESGDAAQAVRTARQALLPDGAHAGALNELGLSLLAADEPDEALVQFRLAQETNPQDPAAYVNEGALHLRRGAVRESRRALRQALQRRPGLVEAENLMAESLARKGLGLAVLKHVVTLARVTLVGWLIIAFLYYLAFRLLQFVWRMIPAALPAGQGLLWITLVWLLGGMAAGHVLRRLFRSGWPK